MLRFGNTLVIIEAKFGSGRHDLPPANDDDEDRCDQLVRQYLCITEPLSRRTRYAEPLERAVPRVPQLMQVFVVDARRQRSARRELEQSKKRLPTGASLQLVTWQSLFRILKAEDTAIHRWRADLSAYFQLSGLDTFDGISHNLAPTEDFQTIQSWWSGFDRARPHFREASTIELAQATALQGWRLPTDPEGETSLCSIDPRILERSARSAILGWHIPELRLNILKRGRLR